MFLCALVNISISFKHAVNVSAATALFEDAPVLPCPNFVPCGG